MRRGKEEKKNQPASQTLLILGAIAARIFYSLLDFQRNRAGMIGEEVHPDVSCIAASSPHDVSGHRLKMVIGAKDCEGTGRSLLMTAMTASIRLVATLQVSGTHQEKRATYAILGLA